MVDSAHPRFEIEVEVDIADRPIVALRIGGVLYMSRDAVLASENALVMSPCRARGDATDTQPAPPQAQPHTPA